MKKYAFITGAAGGLGKSFATACARKGYNLILVDLPGTKLESLANQIHKSFHVDVQVLFKDLSCEAAVDELEQLVLQNDWSLSLLINNAGIGLNQCFESMTSRQIGQLLDVNTKTMARLSYALLPILEKNEASNILNVGSMAGYYALPNKSVYSGSKAFVRLFSLALRVELASKGVKVSLLCPGGILSNIDQYVRFRDGDPMTRMSYLYPDQVATEALDKALKGKAVIMPGLFNKWVWRLTNWLPWFIQEKIATAKYKLDTHLN